MNALAPLPVVLPLAIAALLLATSRILPPRVPDIVAIVTALAALIIAGFLAKAVAGNPIEYWFGGWQPSHGQIIGIGFRIDLAGALMAGFIALLFTLTLVFAWGYFDEVHAHFHVLMLLFMAGMTGFCLTHDLFNLFVWFELMSISAFALTGYQLRSSALEGAINFTVINTLGSYLILGGIGLLYIQIGALDFSALADDVAHDPDSPSILAGFSLLSVGLLIKAAQVPFQFWLSDAHAVALSPVSVIFSGAMVGLGIFGEARLMLDVFAGSPFIVTITHSLFLALGTTSIVLGGVMALIQRHVKRLLAFSTIAHTGILLVGLTLLGQQSIEGMLAYLVGHGLVKASLFMVAGIILATCGGIDELGLRGCGKPIWPAGILMTLAGLMLAGLPVGWMDIGMRAIVADSVATHRFWLIAVFAFGAATTGGAVLRVAGRIFLGLGPVDSGEEERAPTAEEREKADRPFWLMMAPAIVLVALAFCTTSAGEREFAAAAVQFVVPGSASVATGMSTPTGDLAVFVSWFPVLLACLIAAFDLGRHRAPKAAVAGVDAMLRPVLNGAQNLHSGKVGDYAVWLALGLAAFAVAFAL
ncbi:MAG TPA: proton-conducting transporter membrane subunit [Stellaceae bacterium]|nr:proton-conducting transporter membrane subunit [Stellaceae bacterium]